MKIFYCDHFVLPIPPGHRFPMEKYGRLRGRVESAALGGPGALRVPPPAGDRELGRAHDPEWVRRVVDGRLAAPEIRRIGFPWSPGLVERSRRSVGGTLAAARGALEEGVAVNLAGGTHHAFADRGEGFCVFNDVAVAACVLLAEERVGRVAILDLDVHQGNGTARIFRDNPSVLTVSVHGAGNFPFVKERSDVDIELPDGTRDARYLAAVDRALERALSHAPDLLFYVSGADAFAGDRLGRLSVSKEGLDERDRRVQAAAAAAGAPVVVTMSGGYAARVEDTVDIHFATVSRAAERAEALRLARSRGSPGALAAD